MNGENKKMFDYVMLYSGGLIMESVSLLTVLLTIYSCVVLIGYIKEIKREREENES